MSRIRLVVLTAAAAALASVALASAAQAHEYRVAGSALVGSASLAERAETSNQELLGTPFGVAVHIICKTVTEKNSEITAPEGGISNLEYTNCEATKPANCTVKQPINVDVKTKLTGPTPGVKVLFEPKVGTEFTTITLEGASCSLKEPFTVTGSQECNLPGGETENAEHEIECTTGGSKLKAGGKAATYSGGIKKLKLVSGESWSAL